MTSEGQQNRRRRAALPFALIVAGTVLGLAGTDLILPAVPGLPASLGGTPAQAQLVLAVFVAGAALGLIAFGALGAHFDQRILLIHSLGIYATVSALAAHSPDLTQLIVLRFVQGTAGAAPAVFAPGMIRALYGDQRAVGALGLLGSIESLVPALAPIAGVWLLRHFGWTAAFDVIAILAFLLMITITLLRRRLPPLITRPGRGGYGHLLQDWTFLRYAVSHAFTLGALLIIVFGAPTIFVTAWGATLTDFIIMQCAGIATFIAAANAAGRLTRRFGAERVIGAGTFLSAAGGVALLVYALKGGMDPALVTAAFVPINMGLGLRGPPGFHYAVLAADGDDARGAALVTVAILATAAIGTALIAPSITQGLLPVAAMACGLLLAALLLLSILPKLEQGAQDDTAGE